MISSALLHHTVTLNEKHPDRCIFSQTFSAHLVNQLLKRGVFQLSHSFSQALIVSPCLCLWTVFLFLCLFASFSLSFCISLSLCLFVSVSLSVFNSKNLFECLSVCLSLWLSASPPLCLWLSVSLLLFVLSLYLIISFSLCLYISILALLSLFVSLALFHLSLSYSQPQMETGGKIAKKPPSLTNAFPFLKN